MESMDPGQLSVTLYSVCKILSLNTEPPSVDVGFFSTTYPVQSVRIASVFIYNFFSVLQVLQAGFDHRYKHKHLMRIK